MASAERRETIEAYLRAKDDNRPALVARAFTDDATVGIVAPGGTIAFPPRLSGRDVIEDVLVRQFGRLHENVRTYCLSVPPRSGVRTFRCPWLVVMTEKGTRRVRLGAGTYDWRFTATDGRAEHLAIAIAAMETLAPARQRDIFAAFDPLPWPWCPLAAMLDALRSIPGSGPVSAWLAVVA